MSPNEVPSIDFVRLPRIPLGEVVTLLNDTRMRRHLPLATGDFSTEAAAAWVQAKDGQWDEHGFGPWAILVDGRFAGWGGFQHEDGGADYALVLAPAYWGHGAAITRTALAHGFGEFGLDRVLIALPYTRNAESILSRWDFRPDGEVSHGGVTFRRFALTRGDWQRAAGTGSP